MSQVKRWYIGVYGGEAQARPCSPAEFEIIRDRDRRYFVIEDDYERVVAERDALQQRLTAADERADVLIKTLTNVREALGREYWDQYAGLDETRDILDAALKPAEGGGDEAI